MKKNVMLIGSIMFVAAGCAHQSANSRVGYDPAPQPDMTETAWSHTDEAPDRNPDGMIENPASVTLQSDPAGESSTGSTTIRAQGVEPYSSAESSSLITQGEGERDEYEISAFDSADGGIRASANWNPSDDLLPDGVEMNNDASVGGAATGETGSASSSDVHLDLNSSDQLEKNISGEFDISETRSTDEQSDQNSLPEPQIGVTGDETEWLFQNNRARGVGSAATGEFGVAHSRDPLAQMSSSDRQLAESVKQRLMEESTGTKGLTRIQAENIEVTARDGEVYLRGEVPSEQERKLVEIRAAEIAEVKKVHNELTLEAENTKGR